MRWREFVALLGGLAIAWPLACYAQQPTRAPSKRVGLLSQLPCPIPPGIMRRRLAELGWIEGQTFVFDCVSVVGRLDQLPVLARELVSRQPDVVAASAIPLIKALKQETTTIPIVIITTPEPVRTGIVTNLARPEGNVTGVAWFGFDITTKRIELLKEIVPHLRRLALIGDTYSDPKAAVIVDEDLAIAGGTLGFTWQWFRAVAANDYDEIFARLAAEHFDAAYITPSMIINNNVMHIIELALRHRIPAVSESLNWAKGGLLLSYGQDSPWSFARGAEYIDKILRGAKPSDLPVEQATKVLLAINLKTAKALGLTIPPSLLARADEVVE